MSATNSNPTRVRPTAPANLACGRCHPRGRPEDPGDQNADCRGKASHCLKVEISLKCCQKRMMIKRDGRPRAAASYRDPVPYNLSGAPTCSSRHSALQCLCLPRPGALAAWFGEKRGRALQLVVGSWSSLVPVRYVGDSTSVVEPEFPSSTHTRHDRSQSFFFGRGDDLATCAE